MGLTKVTKKWPSFCVLYEKSSLLRFIHLITLQRLTKISLNDNAQNSLITLIN